MKGYIIALIVCGCFAIIVVGLILWCLQNRKKKKAWSPSPPPPVSDVEKCRSSVVPRDGGLLVLTGTAVTTPVVAAAVTTGISKDISGGSGGDEGGGECDGGANGGGLLWLWRFWRAWRVWRLKILYISLLVM
ncbi:hypothetical protein IGI04_029358 [Brassica rapa subsp. trilocularis]|uniref:Uncharacterized protein n=1 Tax=Brassica rapa subsp. trilocularis TaxID=1813537 RepID=A0ABQ7LMP9_BRACM|nr:hypothetical protein IGI04_029358 [Brassica rapa subsp. trilocularis]